MSNNPDALRILADLERHEDLFDLTDAIGDELLDVATAGVINHFIAEVDPNGTPWPELSQRYAEVKERYWPGEQILVREKLLESELPGERTIAPDSAIYTAGESDEGRQEIEWAEEGDPAHNRPERRIVGLNSGSIAESGRILDAHFIKGVDGA